jgi:hypothetical protein
MKSHLHKTLLQAVKDLHIKILQSNNLHEISHYLQEILDKITPVPATSGPKVVSQDMKVLSKSRIINMMKTDIKFILDGTYNRAEIAKYKASMSIAWLKRLFADPVAQK